MCDSDDDDGAESDDEKAQCFVTRKDATPDGWEVDEKCPIIDSSLVGRRILFRFTLTGWEVGIVRKFYKIARGGAHNFNAEIRTGIPAATRDTCLRAHLYGASCPAAWFVLIPRE